MNAVNDRSAQLLSRDDQVVLFDQFGAPQPRLAMFAYPLANIYPEMLNKSEAEVTAYMRTKFQAQVSEVKHEDCGFFLLGENNEGFIGVAQWDAHGYYLSVPKSAGDSGRHAVETILNSTKFKSCSP